MGLVLDSSVVGSWCFPDETSPVADAAFASVGADKGLVLALWWFEVRNVLLMGERYGRIDPAGTAEFLADLDELPIRTDREPDSATVLALARVHRLTFYDAAYLELARRLSAPLASFDRALVRAARAAAVLLLDDQDT